MLSAESIIDGSFEYSPNVRIHYEVEGDGGIPVVFLHGFGASLHSWDEIRNLFPRDQYKLYLLDLKGFGLSSMPKKGDYSIKEQARIVSAFLSQYLSTPAVLIGHSYGGGVALMTQLLCKSTNDKLAIQRLVLLDTAAYLDDIPFFVRMLANPLIKTIAMPILSASFKAKYTLMRLFYRREKVTPERIERYAKFYRQPGSNHAMIQAAKQIIPKDHRDVIASYKHIKTPTLIIWGRNDPALPLALGERLEEEIPLARLQVIDECGHIPQEERPTETMQAIIEFLTKG